MHLRVVRRQIQVEMSGQGHSKHWGLWSALSAGTKGQHHPCVSRLQIPAGQKPCLSLSDCFYPGAIQDHLVWCFRNSQTLTRPDFSLFQRQVWKISPGTAGKRTPAWLLHKETRQPPVTVNFLLRWWRAATWRGEGHAATLGIGHTIPHGSQMATENRARRGGGHEGGRGCGSFTSTLQVHLPLPRRHILGSSQDVLGGGSGEYRRLALSVPGQTAQPFWSQYLPLWDWDGIHPPCSAYCGQEGQRRPQVGKSSKALKKFCMLLGLCPCLRWDKESTQMLKQPKYEDSVVSTGLTQLHPGRQPMTSNCWRPVLLPHPALEFSCRVCSVSGKVKRWAVGEGESQWLSDGQSKGSVKPAGLARCGKLSRWLSLAHKWGWAPSACSPDAHPDEVTTHCRGQGAGLVVPHLVSFGFGALEPLTDTRRATLSSWIRRSASVLRIHVRFHTCSLEERGHGAGEEACLPSPQVFGFLKKRK